MDQVLVLETLVIIEVQISRIVLKLSIGCLQNSYDIVDLIILDHLQKCLGALHVHRLHRYNRK